MTDFSAYGNRTMSYRFFDFLTPEVVCEVASALLKTYKTPMQFIYADVYFFGMPGDDQEVLKDRLSKTHARIMAEQAIRASLANSLKDIQENGQQIH